MIVRIMGMGQYQIDSCLVDELNKIDNRIVNHVTRGDQKAYKEDLQRLISKVKENGKVMDPKHIGPSEIIIPPEDLSFDEARKVFSGQGLIKD